MNAVTLDTSLQFLKGVGPKLSALLAQKGLKSVGDLLLYLPREYQDRSKIHGESDLPFLKESGDPALVFGQIVRTALVSPPRLRTPILNAWLRSAHQSASPTGPSFIKLTWFRYPKFLKSKLDTNPYVLAFGSVTEYQNQFSLVHPELEFDADRESLQNKAGSSRTTPIYPLTEGLHQKTIQKLARFCIENYAQLITDDLPHYLMQQLKFSKKRDVIKRLHLPTAEITVADLNDFKTPEQQQLAFEELFKLELIIGKRRLNYRNEVGLAFPQTPLSKNLWEQFLKNIPFQLTNDQNNAIERIFEDISTTKPMNRLLLGDVGCGKTMVALAAAIPVAASGGQTALLAPTEILASQHFINAEKFLSTLTLPNGKPFRIGLLTGSTNRLEREKLLLLLKLGEIQLLIGTHALLEPGVEFPKLGLVVIDEQHRFGVDQRKTLRLKGQHPHTLSLTATPIPRTLAITAYGDLDITAIKELPAGRPEVYTKILKQKKDSENSSQSPTKDLAYDVMLKELAAGRQAYVIFPLIEESEKIDLANAIQGAEELANGAFAQFRVGLLHGRMKPQEKAEIMQRFKANQVQLLVSTTVVEVGVDVPNATVMLIEHAERFGLSQLHQLRGRIGRGKHTSYCFLLNSGGSKISFERLRAMELTRDGFKLSEMDLELRGPGDFLGTRQSGELQFQFANLVRDHELLNEARRHAFELLKKDPHLQAPEHESIRRYLLGQGALQMARFETA